MFCTPPVPASLLAIKHAFVHNFVYKEAGGLKLLVTAIKKNTAQLVADIFQMQV